MGGMERARSFTKARSTSRRDRAGKAPATRFKRCSRLVRLDDDNHAHAMHSARMEDLMKCFSFIATPIAVGLVTLASPAAQQRTYRATEIDEGAAMYAANCFSCHAEGQGVAGVDLRNG